MWSDGGKSPLIPLLRKGGKPDFPVRCGQIRTFLVAGDVGGIESREGQDWCLRVALSGFLDNEHRVPQWLSWTGPALLMKVSYGGGPYRSDRYNGT